MTFEEAVAEQFQGDRRRLAELIAKARRAEMTVWAYAVHTGRAHDLHLTEMYRICTDVEYARACLRRHLADRWRDSPAAPR